MKILFLTQYFPPEIGAAPTRLAAMMQELQLLGHSVEVVTAMPNYPTGKIFSEYRKAFYVRELWKGIPVHRVWLYVALGGGLGRILNYISFSLFSAWGLFKAAKPDYLFVESPPLTLSVPAFLYSRIRNVPFILNIADLWPDTIVEMGLLGKGLAFRSLLALERWSYRKAAYVNAITEGLKESLLRGKNVPLEKLLFLPNGVDTQKFRPQPPDAQLKEKLGLRGKKVILYMGTQGQAHSLDNVLRAAKILQDRPDIHFLFVGDGSERKNLEGLRRELGLENVSFHNPVPIDQVPAYYSIADSGLASLRAIPIFESARPSKMFPILASGKPLLFFGGGEGARLVQAAKAGIVVPAENPDALASTVAHLCGDEKLAQELGANGRRYAEENYQWSKIVRNWVDSLSARGSGSPLSSNVN